MPVGRNTSMCYSKMQIRQYRWIANIWLTGLISRGLSIWSSSAAVCHSASCLFYRCAQHMKGRLSVNPLLHISKMWMIMHQFSPFSGPNCWCDMMENLIVTHCYKCLWLRLLCNYVTNPFHHSQRHPSDILLLSALGFPQFMTAGELFDLILHSPARTFKVWQF